jgi:septum formation protein
MPAPRLILASASPRRRELMTEAGYRFDVIPPHETAECGICSTGGPAALVAELATSKAVDVAAQLKHRNELEDNIVLIACDTIAECGGEILGKPRDEDHARAMLLELRGSESNVVGLPMELLREMLTLIDVGS